MLKNVQKSVLVKDLVDLINKGKTYLVKNLY